MKTSRIALVAGAAVIAGALALPAFAQPGPGQGRGPDGPRRGAPGFAMGEAFARADTNADSQVSRDEGWVWLQARFAEVDGNRDGGVTIEEFRAYVQTRMGGRTPPAGAREQGEQRGQAMFRVLDVNSDGRVTLEEIRPFAEAMFRSRDANSDGQLTRQEVMPRRASHHRGPHGHGQGGERRGPPAQQQSN
ncbi:EF-hand domain-containing protein [Roseomonas sp. AR75]|uniref:EF-hand domain-containing protein n=1 Tax=Roseomonas sp. AR75 TaxID=2562311 RepID=UPI00148534D4|nr:EF-hand domain-containing protein [Roseomonas sp. AR75]